DRRAEVLAALTADSPGEVEAQVRSDLLELALLWSDLRLRLAGRGPPAAGRCGGLPGLPEAGRVARPRRPLPPGAAAAPGGARPGGGGAARRGTGRPDAGRKSRRRTGSGNIPPWAARPAVRAPPPPPRPN